MAGRSWVIGLLLLLFCGCAEYGNTGFVYPNTVTPNNDALNEWWCISYMQTGLEDTLTGFTLKIYDVANNEVYRTETTQQQACWEITPASITPGTYYFIVDYYTTSAPGEKKTFWGEVKVVF